MPPVGWHGFDGDKAACGVRISAKPGRTSAERPGDVVCSVCALRILRSLQDVLGDDEGVKMFTSKTPPWPWELADTP